MGAFAWSPIRRLMRDQGAEIVSRDAVDRLIGHLEVVSKKITQKALQFSAHAGRKKVTTADIDLAIKLLNKKL